MPYGFCPPTIRSRDAAELDLLGAATVMVGLVTLVYGVVGTAQHGWGSGRTLLLLGVAGVLLAAFIGIERRGGSRWCPLRPGASAPWSRAPP